MSDIISWGRADAPFVCLDDLVSQLKSAAELLLLMTEIAEDAYCESWSDGTAPSLWRVVLNAEGQPDVRDGLGYGRTAKAEARELARLCRQAQCWWTWDELANEVAMVPLSEWAAEHGKPEWMP